MIIDTFLFSELHEADLLWLKFMMGDAGVDHWILVENNYTFGGEYKGVFARELLAKDPRFAPFLKKITVISGDIKIERLPNEDLRDGFQMRTEIAQRDLAVKEILVRYHDDDWIIISDTDEMLDFSDVERKEIILRHLREAQGDFLRVPHLRFCYDFDNLWPDVLSMPIARVRKIKASGMSLRKLRWGQTGAVPLWEKQVCFEYSYCFGKEHMLRKVASTARNYGLVNEDMELSLRCNQRVVPKNPEYQTSARAAGVDLEVNWQAKWWLRKTALTAENSPVVVRKHLAALRTKVVDPDYEANRRREYPYLFPQTLWGKAVLLGRKLLWQVTRFTRRVWHKIARIMGRG